VVEIKETLRLHTALDDQLCMI